MKISVCMGSSCFTRGNNEVLPVLQDHIARTPRLSGCQLVGHLCAGRCQEGPIVEIEGAVHPRMEPQAAVELVDWLNAAGGAHAASTAEPTQ